MSWLLGYANDGSEVRHTEPPQRPGDPRCALHGPMIRRGPLYWWVCPGFDGEGCWVPVVTDELLVSWYADGLGAARNSGRLLMIPARPASWGGGPPEPGRVRPCRCRDCPGQATILGIYGPALPAIDCLPRTL